jgi:hypothetical protein
MPVSAHQELPYDVERGLVSLISKELGLAQESEMLKQQLATSYDYSLDKLMCELDDCNLRFIDSAAIKRFLIKCRVYPSDSLLIAVIRRLDLDADARLCYQEFRDGILPMENFTKGSLKVFEKTIEARRPRRPVTAVPKTKLPSKISNTLHGKDTEQARLHLKQDDVY